MPRAVDLGAEHFLPESVLRSLIGQRVAYTEGCTAEVVAAEINEAGWVALTMDLTLDEPTRKAISPPLSHVSIRS